MTVIDSAGVAALTGEVVERAAFRRAELLLGERGVLAVVDAGGGTDRSCVWNAEEVRLVGDVPLAGALGEWYPRGDDRPLHVAVRLAEGYLHLGEGRHIRSGTAVLPGEGPHRLTEFVIEPCAPLEHGLLDLVRPVETVALPGLGWLERVADDPMRALEEFAAGWYPASGPSGGPEHPGAPEPLARFHRLAARRPELLGGQNFLRPPQEPDAGSDEPYTLGTENQGVFSWELRRTQDGFGDDPAVWFVGEDGEAVPEEEPLSGFLLQFALHEAAVCADHLALAPDASAEEAAEVVAALRPVPLRPFLAPFSPQLFHVAPGAVASVSPGRREGRFQVWAGASHRSALAPLRDLPVRWNRFDG
ncbi:hypothetical protein [Nocardiopsis sp. CC223A]|uniref:hypothetical protein n=1 Tax=Nocardiopsis sp. CC223A TaxID=3044051 RepID=UPI0027963A55|nr:hypothetical protein [Nocardiopsis sp. CC223A]